MRRRSWGRVSTRGKEGWDGLGGAVSRLKCQQDRPILPTTHPANRLVCPFDWLSHFTSRATAHEHGCPRENLPLLFLFPGPAWGVCYSAESPTSSLRTR